MGKNLTLGELTAKPGEKVSGWLHIADSGLEIPVSLICGMQDGPTVLVTGGIHNAEYVGIQAAIELREELKPSQMRGKVILFPLVNRTGFEHRTMSMVYEDGKNINREFPGDPSGTLTEQICHTFVDKVFPQVDYYIDLHCGDGYEELYPHVYTLGAASPKVNQASDAMARAVNVKFRYPSQNPSGGSYNQAGSMGVPGILLERGGRSVWSREEVEADKEDICNVLRHLHVLEGEPEYYDTVQRKLSDGYFLIAGHTGIWYPCHHAGDRIKKGELLGVIKDYMGNIVEEYYAEASGILLIQTVSLNVLKGGAVLFYCELKEQENSF
ncbi:MAG TPA: succinylglutamate desuccinylase/aspartoacylase family protein [Candidatus Ruminococcus avistercoris]|nr:succinylglutamate desuccinylase/aspartoacylase family protein [Candidatus Ruminococcus avistercoris]